MNLTSELKAHGQQVLVLQGGGALGAYQVGVYQALHEAGIEPDWVIGTSIGAINAAIIAGSAFDERMDRLGEFSSGGRAAPQCLLPMRGCGTIFWTVKCRCCRCCPFG